MSGEDEVVLTLESENSSPPHPHGYAFSDNLSPLLTRDVEEQQTDSFFDTAATLEIVEKKEVRLIGHSNQIKAVVVLPDGRVASASADTTVRVFQPGTAKQDIKIELQSVAYGLHVLPDGALAVACGDHSVQLFRIEGTRMQRLGVLAGHESAVFSVYSIVDVHGHNICITGSRDTTVKLWDLLTFTCIATLKGHTDIVGAILQLEDHILCTGSTDNTIKLWDIATCECIATLYGHSAAVVRLLRLPGHYFASASKDHTIRIWDYRLELCTNVIRGHTDSVWGLVRLPNTLILSGGDDGRICLVHPLKGEIMTTVPNPHGTIHDLDLHPDGTLLVANHDDFSVGQFTLPPWVLASPPEELLRQFNRAAHRRAASSATATEAGAPATEGFTAPPAPARTAVASTPEASILTENGLLTLPAKTEDAVTAALLQAQADIARLRTENARLRDAEFRSQSEIANLKGVIATLLKSTGRTSKDLAGIRATTDAESLSMSSAFTDAMAEQNARIRDLEARSRQLEQRLRDEEARTREVARLAVLPSLRPGGQRSPAAAAVNAEDLDPEIVN